MIRRRIKILTAGAALAILFLGVASAAAQTTATTTAATLKITGDVRTPLTLTPADMKGLPRTTVEINEEGRAVLYEGVRVSEILKKAGVPQGAELRGNALATYVTATASDGYQVVFSLGELDPALTGIDIIVADTIDGKPLFAYQGPFRLVVPRDTRPARSVRMLDRLEVVRLRK